MGNIWRSKTSSVPKKWWLPYWTRWANNTATLHSKSNGTMSFFYNGVYPEANQCSNGKSTICRWLMCIYLLQKVILQCHMPKGSHGNRPFGYLVQFIPMRHGWSTATCSVASTIDVGPIHHLSLVTCRIVPFSNNHTQSGWYPFVMKW